MEDVDYRQPGRKLTYLDTARERQRERTFAKYCYMFGYGENGERLKGRRILDIGGGESNFAQKANELGARVVRIDPKYHERKYRPNYVPMAVAGAAEELPFLDNSFDEVVASFSFLWIAKTGKARLEAALAEAWRVTRDGGYIKIYPAMIQRSTSYEVTSNFILPLGAKLVQHENETFPDIKASMKDTTLVIRKDGRTPKDQIEQEIRILAERVRFDHRGNTLWSLTETTRIDDCEVPCFVDGWDQYYQN